MTMEMETEEHKETLENAYKRINKDIPIYSIMFGVQQKHNCKE